MPTTVVKSIGNGSRDYSSIQAWEDACPADLVAVDQVWQGELYMEGGGTNGEWTPTRPTFSGCTTDATRKLVLKAATGQSFADNASRLSNALRYNNANGVAISMTGGYNWIEGGSSEYVEFRGLQIQSQSYIATASIIPKFISCILQSNSANRQLNVPATSINCLYIALGSGGVSEGYDAVFRNCTLIGGGSNTAWLFGSYGAGNIVKNCAVFGFGSFTNNAAKFDQVNSTNDATDLSSFGWSASHVTSLSMSAQFQSLTGGAEDYRAKAGSGLIGAASPDSSFTGDVDIVGQSRSTTAPTIGAWEVVPSGATIVNNYVRPANASQFVTRGIARGKF